MRPRERFGKELRHWRTERGLSQAKLGTLVHRDKSVISRIESGQRPVDAEFVAATERVLNNRRGIVRGGRCGRDDGV